MDITAKVIELLKTYNEKKRKIEQLRFELENPPRLSDDEIISSLNFGTNLPSMNVSDKSHVSDKTMIIAMKYREAGNRLMSEAISQISQELNALEAEISRLEHYMSLLPQMLSIVLRLFYFEGIQNAQIAEKLSISIPTVVNRKNSGIKELVAMYTFLHEVKE